MSRGIRDLRDLICVSRLTVRHSDDEIFSSDEDDNVAQLSRNMSRSSLSGSQCSREGSATTERVGQRSPDSGIGMPPFRSILNCAILKLLSLFPYKHLILFVQIKTMHLYLLTFSSQSILCVLIL